MITDQRAACAGQNPALWDTDLPDRWREGVAICAGCPLRDQCLDEAMRHERTRSSTQRAMIYGGLTPLQRARLARGGACGKPDDDDLEELLPPPSQVVLAIAAPADLVDRRVAVEDAKITRCTCGAWLYDARTCGACGCRCGSVDEFTQEAIISERDRSRRSASYAVSVSA